MNDFPSTREEMERLLEWLYRHGRLHIELLTLYVCEWWLTLLMDEMGHWEPFLSFRAELRERMPGEYLLMQTGEGWMLPPRRHSRLGVEMGIGWFLSQVPTHEVWDFLIRFADRIWEVQRRVRQSWCDADRGGY